MATDHALLRDYAARFHRYGDLSSPVWFLDVEEGGRTSLDELDRRLGQWDRRGRPDVDYLSGPRASVPPAWREYLCRDEGAPRLHPVWSQQLRLLGGLCGQSPGNEALRHLQCHVHGAPGGPTCLVSLYPLPCRSADDWVYDRVPFDGSTPFNPFETKARYRAAIREERLDTLCRLVHRYRPAVLVCMAWCERDALLSVMDRAAPLPLDRIEGDAGAIVASLGSTLVIVCAHPAQALRGSKNRYFVQVGKAAGQALPAGIATRTLVAAQLPASTGQRLGAGTGGGADSLDPLAPVLAQER